MHVRICVECGEEYRPDALVCTDCGGGLQDHLDEGGGWAAPLDSSPTESAADRGERFTERILQEDQATDLVTAADRLVDEGIECRVWPAQRPERAPFALADDDGRGDAALPAGKGYGLWVTAADRERALAALGLSTEVEGAANAHGEGSGGSRACPACGAAVPAGVVDCPGCNLAVGDDTGDEPVD
jgi:hypothetical protein